MSTQAYPLAWPDGWPRTEPWQRGWAKFKKGARQKAETEPERAFSGFVALPAPGQTTGRSWRVILDASEGDDMEAVKAKYRKLCAVHHPDRGGSQDAMSELNWAWAQAQEALK